MLDVFVLALALAVDATAACAGLGASQRSVRPVIAGALLFGVFQAGMAGLGAWGGAAMASWASAWDHWVAFGLLVAIGGKAIHGALSGRDAPAEGAVGDAGLPLLLTLAFATSVDALAAGVTLPMQPVHPAVSAAVIGVVTVVGSAIGGAVGRRLGARLGWRIEAAGGLVLIGLGVKIAFDHVAA